MNNVQHLVNSNIAMLVLSFEKCTMAMSNVTIKGNWVRVYRNSALFLQHFHKFKIIPK